MNKPLFEQQGNITNLTTLVKMVRDLELSDFDIEHHPATFSDIGKTVHTGVTMSFKADVWEQMLAAFNVKVEDGKLSTQRHPLGCIMNYNFYPKPAVIRVNITKKVVLRGATRTDDAKRKAYLNKQIDALESQWEAEHTDLIAKELGRVTAKLRRNIESEWTSQAQRLQEAFRDLPFDKEWKADQFDAELATEIEAAQEAVKAAKKALRALKIKRDDAIRKSLLMSLITEDHFEGDALTLATECYSVTKGTTKTAVWGE